MGLTVGGTAFYPVAQYMECIDMTVNAGDMGPSQTEHTMFENCLFSNVAAGALVEIDKDITLLEFMNCTFETYVLTANSSVDRMIMDGCELLGNFLNTAAKLTEIRNSYIPQLNIGSGEFGPGGSLILENNRIDAVAVNYALCYSQTANMTFSNGTFYMSNSSGNLFKLWQLGVPGTQGLVSYGSIGGQFFMYPFIVTGARQDGTNTYMDTTLASVEANLTLQSPDSGTDTSLCDL